MSDAHSSDNAQPLPFSRLVVLGVASFIAAPWPQLCGARASRPISLAPKIS